MIKLLKYIMYHWWEFRHGTPTPTASAFNTTELNKQSFRRLVTRVNEELDTMRSWHPLHSVIRKNSTIKFEDGLGINDLRATIEFILPDGNADSFSRIVDYRYNVELLAIDVQDMYDSIAKGLGREGFTKSDWVK